MEEKNLDKKEKATAETRTASTKFIVEKRKPSVFLSILLMLIGAVITALIFLICFGNKIISNEETEIPTENVEENTATNNIEDKVDISNLINIDGDLVASLKNKITRNGLYCFTFENEKVTYDQLDQRTKSWFAINKCEYTTVKEILIKSKLNQEIMNYRTNEQLYSNDVKIISYDEANKKYKSIYGPDKELPKENIAGVSYVFEYVSSDNYFYGYYVEGGGGSPLNSSIKYTECKANEDGTELYLYSLIVFAMPVTNKDGIYTITKDFSNKEVIEETSDVTLDEFSRVDVTSLNKYIEAGNCGKYMSTFKLDSNGNYYWLSTEPVQ